LKYALVLHHKKCKMKSKILISSYARGETSKQYDEWHIEKAAGPYNALVRLTVDGVNYSCHVGRASGHAWIYLSSSTVLPMPHHPLWDSASVVAKGPFVGCRSRECGPERGFKLTIASTSLCPDGLLSLTRVARSSCPRLSSHRCKTRTCCSTKNNHQTVSAEFQCVWLGPGSAGMPL
jgi:hypothetical protein